MGTTFVKQTQSILVLMHEATLDNRVVLVLSTQTVDLDLFLPQSCKPI